MIALSSALHAAMIADGAITNELGTWGAPAVPSIFTQRPIPSGASRPTILAADTPSNEPDDLLAQNGREILRDVLIFGRLHEDHDAVDRAAERVLALFHGNRHSITVPGYRVSRIVASGPRDGPVDDGTKEIGRVVTLAINLRAN